MATQTLKSTAASYCLEGARGRAAVASVGHPARAVCRLQPAQPRSGFWSEDNPSHVEVLSCNGDLHVQHGLPLNDPTALPLGSSARRRKR